MCGLTVAYLTPFRPSLLLNSLDLAYFPSWSHPALPACWPDFELKRNAGDSCPWTTIFKLEPSGVA